VCVGYTYMHISILCLLRGPDTQLLVSKKYSLIKRIGDLKKVTDFRAGAEKIQARSRMQTTK
jgi:hypothetical protein